MTACTQWGQNLVSTKSLCKASMRSNIYHQNQGIQYMILSFAAKFLIPLQMINWWSQKFSSHCGFTLKHAHHLPTSLHLHLFTFNASFVLLANLITNCAFLSSRSAHFGWSSLLCVYVLNFQCYIMLYEDFVLLKQFSNRWLDLD